MSGLDLLWWIGGASAAAIAGGLVARRAARSAINRAVDRVTNIVTQDAYGENLIEMVVGLTRSGIIPTIETDLRANSRQSLKRPLGSVRRDFPHFDRLMFDFAQLERMPLSQDQPVRAQTILGPRARRPLVLKTPLMVAGMGYGVALSREAKIALAKGADQAGTATNSGEGPVLPEERQAVGRYIVQYHRGNWMRLSDLAKADMVEIHLGQGASGAAGKRFLPEEIDGPLRQAMGIPRNTQAVSESRFPMMNAGEDLAEVVAIARSHACPGVPVGVKLAAGQSIERDLAYCLDSGVDVIAVDGAQAGTHASLTITEDDFGLPTLLALVRARRFLDRHDSSRSVSLIVSGGLITPGDCLKCLALGADAVYLGTAVLYAMAVGQHERVLPFEPATALLSYRHRLKGRFDPRLGAKRVGDFLISMTEEMCDAARALGRASLRDVSTQDLFALDHEMARFCGLPCALDAVLSPMPTTTSNAISRRR